MAKILIIGASRGIGLEAVRLALAAGHEVRAFARSADRIPGSDPKLERWRGNALDRDALRTALRGVDAVIYTLGVAGGLGMVLRPVRLFSDSTRALIPAMHEAGVNRLICVTGFGAGDSRGSIGCLQRIPFEFLLGRVYEDKSRQEWLIRESGLDWTIVRPGVLTRGPRTGHYRVLAEPHQWRNGLISRQDVAEFLVHQVEDDAYVRKTPVLIKSPL